MTTTAPPRDPAAAPPGAGSASPDSFRCEVCEQEFTHRLALFNHRKKHEREAQQPIEPRIEVRKASRLSRKELDELQSTTAENIRTVGGLLHAGLVALKLARLQHPDQRIRIPRTRFDVPLPAVDTHLPYTILSRSEVTARVLVEHAAENETLLRWLGRFNSWFQGGEVGALVAQHAAAAAFTAGVQGPLLETAAGALGLGDVMETVVEEDAKLRLRVQMLEAELEVERGRRPPHDERGVGG